MKKSATAFMFLSFFAGAAFADSWTGIISDAHCGAMHTALSDADKACIQKCAQGGSPAVFVVGDKVYKIDNQDAVTKHLGHKVTITGKLSGDTVHVDAVKM